MKSLLRILVLTLTISLCHAQDKTVFITSEEGFKKKDKDRAGLFDEAGLLTTFSGSMSFKFNPNRGTTDPDTGETDDNWFVPNGLGIHGGLGIHTTQSIALTINTGIDGKLESKLIAVPVYASLLLNPTINDSSLFFQIGMGQAFALGRGNLSGFYQKYRIGIADEEGLGFFAELNLYGFDTYSTQQLATLNIGVVLFKFD